MDIAERTLPPNLDTDFPCSFAPRAGPIAVRTRYPRGFEGSWHCTDRAQLIYPSNGVMTISTRTGTWVVPPMRACWLPASEGHKVETSTGLEMHSVYCDRLAAMMPDASGIVPVGPLLRELILTLGKIPPEPGAGSIGERIDRWLAGEMTAHRRPPLAMPRIESPMLRRIAAALKENPADARQLTGWASMVGMSPRSLARAFAREAGMSFTQFRRQIRLHASMERLGQGQSVTMVAMDLGFSSVANFIAMFRRATGCTPRTYFSPERAGFRPSDLGASAGLDGADPPRTK